MKEFVEKLIERLEESRKYNEKMLSDSNDCFSRIIYESQMNTYENSIRIVNQLAEEYNQDLTKNNQGWIPVAERLPEYKGEYLITTNFGVTSALYLPKSKKWVDTIEQYFEYSCVAWQSLPEPYKLEGSI